VTPDFRTAGSRRYSVSVYLDVGNRDCKEQYQLSKNWCLGLTSNCSIRCFQDTMSKGKTMDCVVISFVREQINVNPPGSLWSHFRLLKLRVYFNVGFSVRSLLFCHSGPETTCCTRCRSLHACFPRLKSYGMNDFYGLQHLNATHRCRCHLLDERARNVCTFNRTKRTVRSPYA
jgi:hypothetical protein